MGLLKDLREADALVSSIGSSMDGLPTVNGGGGGTALGGDTFVTNVVVQSNDSRAGILEGSGGSASAGGSGTLSELQRAFRHFNYQLEGASARRQEEVLRAFRKLTGWRGLDMRAEGGG